MNKFSLFSISSLPIWFILLIKTWKVPIYLAVWKGFEWAPIEVIFSCSNIVTYISILCLSYGVWSLWNLKYKLKGSPTSLSITINNFHDASQEYVNSLATLTSIFAVLIVNYDTWRDLAIFFVMCILFYICYTKTNFYYANPIMALLNYKIAKVETSEDCKELPSGSIILYKEKKGKMMPYHVADNVYFVL